MVRQLSDHIVFTGKSISIGQESSTIWVKWCNMDTQLSFGGGYMKGEKYCKSDCDNSTFSLYGLPED